METLAWTSKCCCIIGTNQKHPGIFHSRHSFIFFFPFCFFSCSRRSPEAGAAQLGDAAQDQSKAVAAGNGAAQAVWNPFDDDTFSSLPAEEVQHEDKKPAGKKKTCIGCARCARVNANSSEGPGFKTTSSPSRRTVRTGTNILRGVDTGSAGLGCRQLVSRKRCVPPPSPLPPSSL